MHLNHEPDAEPTNDEPDAEPRTPKRKTMIFIRLLVTLLATASAIAAPHAENWPQWRGPSRNGVSAEKNLPVSWSQVANVAWKLPMPAWSGSTPIVWGDRVFLNVADDLKTQGINLHLWCVNRSTGTLLWQRPLGTGNHQERKQNMSTPSPVTDGSRVWVMTGTGILKAFDFEGRELWMRDIQKDYGRFGLNWGYGSSPLLDGDSLFVQVLHGMRTDDPSYLLRIDKETGKTVWKVERPTDARVESPDAYTTPALLQYGGSKEIVLTGGDVVTGHDPATGKELWRARGLNPGKDQVLSDRCLASRLRRFDHRAVARAADAGAQGGRTRRRDDEPSAVDVRSRTGRADPGDGRHVRLRPERPRHRVLPRGADRKADLRAAAAALRHVQRIAGARRRQDLHHQ